MPRSRVRRWPIQRPGSLGFEALPVPGQVEAEPPSFGRGHERDRRPADMVGAGVEDPHVLDAHLQDGSTSDPSNAIRLSKSGRSRGTPLQPCTSTSGAVLEPPRLELPLLEAGEPGEEPLVRREARPQRDGVDERATAVSTPGSSAADRPETTTPKTTSSSPERRARSRAQAPWTKVFSVSRWRLASSVRAAVLSGREGVEAAPASEVRAGAPVLRAEERRRRREARQLAPPERLGLARIAPQQPLDILAERPRRRQRGLRAARKAA